MEVKGQTKM